MKRLICLYTLCYIFLLVLGWYHTNVQYRELELRLETEVTTRDTYIKELEKEIRLLRTDVSIINNGFPEK